MLCSLGREYQREKKDGEEDRGEGEGRRRKGWKRREGNDQRS